MDRSLSLLAKGAHVSEYLYYEFRAVDRPLTQISKATPIS